MVRCGGDSEQLLAAGDGGVVYSLDVDVVATHHEIADLRVLLCVRHLEHSGAAVNIYARAGKLLDWKRTFTCVD